MRYLAPATDVHDELDLLSLGRADVAAPEVRRARASTLKVSWLGRIDDHTFAARPLLKGNGLCEVADPFEHSIVDSTPATPVTGFSVKLVACYSEATRKFLTGTAGSGTYSADF